MTLEHAGRDSPAATDLGRHATLYHARFGALDRVHGPQKTDGARFYAAESEHARLIIEYPDDAALAAAWEQTLFETPTHYSRVKDGQEGDA